MVLRRSLYGKFCHLSYYESERRNSQKLGCQVLKRGEGRELEDTASSGSAWSLPGGERSPGHIPTPVSSHPQTGLHMALPWGVPVLTPCPGPGRLEPNPAPSGCHRQSAAQEEE